jgi:flavodoxin
MSQPKILVVFYSRTGQTRQTAAVLAKALFECDQEELLDFEERKGILGYILSGLEALFRRPTLLRPIKHNPSDYDLVVIGSPVWNASICSPILTYLKQYRESFKQMGFFLTFGGIGKQSVYQQIKQICPKKPLSMLTLTERDKGSEIQISRIKKFAHDLVSKFKETMKSEIAQRMTEKTAP